MIIYVLLGIVSFGILPDQYYIFKTILNILIVFYSDFLLHCAQIHRVCNYCRVVHEVEGFPINRLPKYNRVISIDDTT